MRERTAALGGDLQMTSRPGRGTVLTFTIPLIEHTHGERQAVPA
jgi:signal transduction histidine kinase